MEESNRLLLEETFRNLREDLKRIVCARLDRRLNGRIDSSDIVQETYGLAFRRYGEYLANPKVSLEEWLRYLTIQSVTAAHRFHLARVKRSVRREVVEQSEDLSIVRVVDMLAGSLTSPHSAAVKRELQEAVTDLVKNLSVTDREILRLRHEEMLSNEQCASQIGITTAAASKRYIRAIKRLRQVADRFLK